MNTRSQQAKQQQQQMTGGRVTPPNAPNASGDGSKRSPSSSRHTPSPSPQPRITRSMAEKMEHGEKEDTPLELHHLKKEEEDNAQGATTTTDGEDKDESKKPTVVAQQQSPKPKDSSPQVQQASQEGGATTGIEKENGKEEGQPSSSTTSSGSGSGDEKKAKEVVAVHEDEEDFEQVEDDDDDDYEGEGKGARGKSAAAAKVPVTNNTTPSKGGEATYYNLKVKLNVNSNKYLGTFQETEGIINRMTVGDDQKKAKEIRGTVNGFPFSNVPTLVNLLYIESYILLHQRKTFNTIPFSTSANSLPSSAKISSYSNSILPPGMLAGVNNSNGGAKPATTSPTLSVSNMNKNKPKRGRGGQTREEIETKVAQIGAIYDAVGTSSSEAQRRIRNRIIREGLVKVQHPYDKLVYYFDEHGLDTRPFKDLFPGRGLYKLKNEEQKMKMTITSSGPLLVPPSALVPPAPATASPVRPIQPKDGTTGLPSSSGMSFPNLRAIAPMPPLPPNLPAFPSYLPMYVPQGAQGHFFRAPMFPDGGLPASLERAAAAAAQTLAQSPMPAPQQLRSPAPEVNRKQEGIKAQDSPSVRYQGESMAIDSRGGEDEDEAGNSELVMDEEDSSDDEYVPAKAEGKQTAAPSISLRSRSSDTSANSPSSAPTTSKNSSPSSSSTSDPPQQATKRWMPKLLPPRSKSAEGTSPTNAPASPPSSASATASPSDKRPAPTTLQDPMKRIRTEPASSPGRPTNQEAGGPKEQKIDDPGAIKPLFMQPMNPANLQHQQQQGGAAMGQLPTNLNQFNLIANAAAMMRLGINPATIPQLPIFPMMQNNYNGLPTDPSTMIPTSLFASLGGNNAQPISLGPLPAQAPAQPQQPPSTAATTTAAAASTATSTPTRPSSGATSAAGSHPAQSHGSPSNAPQKPSPKPVSSSGSNAPRTPSTSGSGASSGANTNANTNPSASPSTPRVIEFDAVNRGETVEKVPFCMHCGGRYPSEAKFCPFCGAKRVYRVV